MIRSILLKIQNHYKTGPLLMMVSWEVDYYSYVSRFNTSGDWETVNIAFKDFVPQFRGRVLDMANFEGETMEEVAFLIGNKVKESFQLEIESISLSR